MLNTCLCCILSISAVVNTCTENKIPAGIVTKKKLLNAV